MFTKSKGDIARTMDTMCELARPAVNYDQSKAAQQVAEWMSNDRRFDHVPDKLAAAKSYMDARAHGRAINIDGLGERDSGYYPNGVSVGGGSARIVNNPDRAR